MAISRHTVNVTAESYSEDTVTRQLINSLANELKRFAGAKVKSLTVFPIATTRSYGWKKQKARMTIVVESSEIAPNV